MKKPILTGVILIIVGLCCFGGGEEYGAVTWLGLALFVAGIALIVTTVKSRKKGRTTQTSAPRAVLSQADRLEPQVVGLSYRVDNVEAAGKLNPEFDMPDAELIEAGKTTGRIYKYSFHGAAFSLEQEPGNPHDPHAIKVLANGVHIGYIAADETGPVNALINSGNYRRTKGSLYGGRYKTYDAGSQTFRTVDSSYGARITVYSI